MANYFRINSHVSPCAKNSRATATTVALSSHSPSRIRVHCTSSVGTTYWAKSCNQPARCNTRRASLVVSRVCATYPLDPSCIFKRTVSGQHLLVEDVSVTFQLPCLKSPTFSPALPLYHINDSAWHVIDPDTLPAAWQWCEITASMSR